MEPMDLPSHAVFQPQKRLCVAIDEKRDFLGQSQVRTEPNSICAHSICVIITCIVLFCCRCCCCLQIIGAKELLNSNFLYEDNEAVV